MNLKQKIKITASCLITAGVTLLLFAYSTILFGEKAADEKYAPFFEQDEDYDVLFMGTSHMIYGISPMDLWDDYGIVSYNFGTPAQTIPCTYWLMENALDYTTPKLMVIDCYTLSDTRKIVVSAHSSFDAFPLSRTKIESIFDLFEHEETDLTRMEFFWNYASYHFRWNDLDHYDFEANPTKGKGGGFLYEIECGNEMTKISREDKMKENTAGVEYLEKMIQDCQNRGIDVLLTFLPFPAGEDSQREANRVYDIAEQYGVNYINFLDLDIVNYETDCADDNHLNVFGIRKVTDYIGKYIMEHYTIADQRINDVYSNWHADYTDYRNELSGTLNGFESLDYCLLLLFDNNYSTIIEVNSPTVWNNDYYVNLFENMGISGNDITKATDFLVIQNAGKQADCFENFHESGNSITTSLGELRFLTSEAGDSSLYLNDQEICTAPSEDYSKADIRVIVFDKNTSELINQYEFSKTTTKAVRSYRRN